MRERLASGTARGKSSKPKPPTISTSGSELQEVGASAPSKKESLGGVSCAV